MRPSFIRRALLAIALIGAGLGVATSPVQASHPTAFGPANPPVAYTATVEKARTVKGVKGLPKGNLSRANARLLTGPYYFYAGASQYLAAGESASSYASNQLVSLPALDTAKDSHTLGEVAVQSHNQQQTVEAGWTHDPIVCGAGNSPCLFTGTWKNGVFRGYNTGFVDWAANPINVGATLTPNTQKRFQIQYSGGNWWVAYDLAWIGYFPGTIWTNAPGSVTFDKFGVAQGFYEVATKSTGDTTPCTDMANGKLGTDPVGPWATSGTNSLGGTLPGAIANNFGGFSTIAGIYDHNTINTQTTRAGGPGYNAAGTGVGAIGVPVGC